MTRGARPERFELNRSVVRGRDGWRRRRQPEWFARVLGRLPPGFDPGEAGHDRAGQADQRREAAAAARPSGQRANCERGRPRQQSAKANQPSARAPLDGILRAMPVELEPGADQRLSGRSNQADAMQRRIVVAKFEQARCRREARHSEVEWQRPHVARPHRHCRDADEHSGVRREAAAEERGGRFGSLRRGARGLVHQPAVCPAK